MVQIHSPRPLLLVNQALTAIAIGSSLGTIGSIARYETLYCEREGTKSTIRVFPSSRCCGGPVDGRRLHGGDVSCMGFARGLDVERRQQRYCAARREPR